MSKLEKQTLKTGFTELFNHSFKAFEVILAAFIAGFILWLVFAAITGDNADYLWRD